MNRTFPKHFTI